MSSTSPELHRLRMILLTSLSKPRLEELKRMVPRWQRPGSPGQAAINHAIVRALDEVQNRLDSLIRT